MKYVGKMGGKGTWTTARGRLPEGILKKYLQCRKDVKVGPQSKAVRYKNPLVSVKRIEFSARDVHKPYSCIL